MTGSFKSDAALELYSSGNETFNWPHVKSGLRHTKNTGESSVL